METTKQSRYADNAIVQSMCDKIIRNANPGIHREDKNINRYVMPLALIDLLYEDIQDMYDNSERDLKYQIKDLLKYISSASHAMTSGMTDDESYELSNIEDDIRSRLAKDRENLINAISEHMRLGIEPRYAVTAAHVLFIRQISVIAYRFMETTMFCRLHHFNMIDKKCLQIVRFVCRRACGVPTNEKAYKKKERKVEKTTGMPMAHKDRLEEDSRVAQAQILLSETIFGINIDEE